jgi:hypothetical protein
MDLKAAHRMHIALNAGAHISHTAIKERAWTSNLWGMVGNHAVHLYWRR